MKATTKTSILVAALALVGPLAPRPASAQQATCWAIAMPVERFQPILLNQCTGETWILGEGRAGYGVAGQGVALPQWNLLPRTQQRGDGRGSALTLQDLVRMADDERERRWFAERFPDARPGDLVPGRPDRKELRRLYPGEDD
jgi:hypothetical protein